jgi:hypothetical protein
MAKRKNRTPEEILQELREKEQKQLAKLASKSLADRTDTAPLVEALTDVRKAITVARRGFSSGPQSFEARIEKHEAWIEKIRNEQLNAESTIADLEAQRDELSCAFDTIAACVAEDPDLDYSVTVQTVLHEDPPQQQMEAN